MRYVLEGLFWVSVLAVVYAYAIYPVLLLLFRWVRRPVERRMSKELPHVSILIAAFNEEKVIRRRIENCLKLDYPVDRLEVIIASDGSVDQTNEIAREYGHAGIRLHEYPERRGKVNVLNDSAPRAEGEIILFSDANTFFAEDAVKKLVRHFGDERIGCACGRLQFVNADGSRTADLEGVYWRFETLLKRLEGERGSLLGANGAIFALRKALYEPCPPQTIVEDFVLPMKVLQNGHQVVFEPDALATEEAPPGLAHEYGRRTRIGAGDLQALGMLLPMLNPFRGFPALAFFSHKVLRWFGPFFLGTALVTNLFLASVPGYRGTLLLQGAFYFSAAVGGILEYLGRPVRLFSLPYYFVSMNWALFAGYLRLLLGRQKVTWRRTER